MVGKLRLADIFVWLFQKNNNLRLIASQSEIDSELSPHN